MILFQRNQKNELDLIYVPKHGREGHTLEDMARNKKDKGLDTSKTHYKLPLVWIKLETTGLNVEVDRILEIAYVITDGKLRKLVEGPDLVIHQTKDLLDKVGERCQDHQAASGKASRYLLHYF